MEREANPFPQSDHPSETELDKYRFDHKIENILASTNFDTLKRNEEKCGFDEAIKDKPFFNVGKAQQWKTQLNSTQKNLIENEFRDEMVKFKYL